VSNDFRSHTDTHNILSRHSDYYDERVHLSLLIQGRSPPTDPQGRSWRRKGYRGGPEHSMRRFAISSGARNRVLPRLWRGFCGFLCADAGGPAGQSRMWQVIQSLRPDPAKTPSGPTSAALYRVWQSRRRTAYLIRASVADRNVRESHRLSRFGYPPTSRFRWRCSVVFRLQATTFERSGLRRSRSPSVHSPLRFTCRGGSSAIGCTFYVPPYLLSLNSIGRALAEVKSVAATPRNEPIRGYRPLSPTRPLFLANLTRPLPCGCFI
jgi:hypothetical protein